MMLNNSSSFTSVHVQKDHSLINNYGTTANTESNPGHIHPYPSKDIVGGNKLNNLTVTPEKYSRTSWEENDSDDNPYPADYTYGRDDDDEDEDEDERERKPEDRDQPSRSTNGLQDETNGQSSKTFDQAPEDDEAVDAPPNRNLFRSSATPPSTSLNPTRPYSSHTKHHSFGYGNDRPEHSESESESNSESESDAEENSSRTFPVAPPVPTATRPVSTISNTASAYRSPSNPGSPTQSRFSTLNSVPPKTGIAAAPSSTSPTLSRTSVSGAGFMSNQKSPMDPKSKRVSGSESDASNSSNNFRTADFNEHLRNAPGATGLSRSISSASSTRGLTNGRFRLPRRTSSYSDLSDTELNEVLLDEPSDPNAAKRRSKGSTTATPRTSIIASNAGFPSSFFNGKPHPKSQQYQQQQPSQTNSQSATAAPAPASSASSATSESRVTGMLNGPISSFASTIQGAFMGRGFGTNTTTTTPPSTTSKSPSGSSFWGSNGGGAAASINTSGIDHRGSQNVSPERASMYSNRTIDSNMDLLLARLEAQNSLVEQESKRRMTNESEMDRVLGHAKEESVGEDVDWDYWGSLMHDYDGVVKKNPKQLTLMIQKGVPPALRGLIWQILAQSKNPQLEADYAELLKATSLHEKQINRDMSRTFPNHEYFQAEGLGQESLFNVVKAYSLYDSEVGYCQGLSFVVGPLLLNMPDEEAFCLLVRMMKSYDMRGHFTPDMSTLQLRLYQFEQLMEETVPLVYKHFQNQGIRSTMYASQWFMTLFAYKFPLDLVFRIYDILFVEGVESLLRFGIALLKANHDQILHHDFEALVDFLKNGLFEYYKSKPELFVQDAFNVKVTPKKLAQYAQKHAAMIQKQQAEIAAEESLRESNRHLSAEVRRLEATVHTLNKEHVELAKELITRKMEMAQLQDKNDVLSQKVIDLTKIVDSQAKEVEDRLKGEIQSVMERNLELTRKNEQLEDQCASLENMLIETKMKYAASEDQRDALTRKLADLRKALGVV